MNATFLDIIQLPEFNREVTLKLKELLEKRPSNIQDFPAGKFQVVLRGFKMNGGLYYSDAVEPLRDDYWEHKFIGLGEGHMSIAPVGEKVDLNEVTPTNTTFFGIVKVELVKGSIAKDELKDFTSLSKISVKEYEPTESDLAEAKKLRGTDK